MMHGVGFWGWGMFLMFGLWIVFLGGLAWFIKFIVSGDKETGSSDSQSLLDRRLASGEISLQEYEELRSALSG